MVVGGEVRVVPAGVGVGGLAVAVAVAIAKLAGAAAARERAEGRQAVVEKAKFLFTSNLRTLDARDGGALQHRCCGSLTHGLVSSGSSTIWLRASEGQDYA